MSHDVKIVNVHEAKSIPDDVDYLCFCGSFSNYFDHRYRFVIKDDVFDTLLDNDVGRRWISTWKPRPDVVIKFIHLSVSDNIAVRVCEFSKTACYGLLISPQRFILMDVIDISRDSYRIGKLKNSQFADYFRNNRENPISVGHTYEKVKIIPSGVSKIVQTNSDVSAAVGDRVRECMICNLEKKEFVTCKTCKDKDVCSECVLRFAVKDNRCPFCRQLYVEVKFDPEDYRSRWEDEEIDEEN